MTSEGCACGVYHQGVGSGSFESYVLKLGPPRIGLTPACPIRGGFAEFGALVNPFELFIAARHIAPEWFS